MTTYYWSKIAPKIESSIKAKKHFLDEKPLQCPSCGSHAIDFQYVGDKNTRNGYMIIWCNSCLHGIHRAPVSIPYGAEYLPFGAQLSNRIPNIRLVT